MATKDQKIITWDRTDSTFNDTLNPFYDSSTKVVYSSFVLLKKSFTDMTLDTSFTDMGGVKNIGQWHYKHNDLNIFAEQTYNRFIGHDLEMKLFDSKNNITYTPDIYNKYENYLLDNTSGLIIKLDLTSILSQFDNDPDFMDVMEHSNGCHVKYYFNVRSIRPLRRKTISYEDVIKFYTEGNAQAYFKNVNPVIKSCLSQNRLLYDHFYTHRRKSFILWDSTTGTDYVSAYFYNFRYDAGKVYFTLFKYDTNQAFRHSIINQLVESEQLYTNTTATQFMFRQHGNTLDIHNSDQHGSYSIITPNNWGHNPVHIVYDSAPSYPRNTCFGGKIADFTADLSNITDFLASSIKLVEINDGKQHVQVDSSTQSSVYTLRITTTENKQFSIPFVVDLTSLDAFNQHISMTNVLDKTSCTLFDQNELNTKWTTSGWTIEQDTFVIDDVLALQSFDSTLGVITFNLNTIKITNNERVFKIVSALSKIYKLENYYLNEYIFINRNLHNLCDPQNQTELTICMDYPEQKIEERQWVTPFGGAESQNLVSLMWNSHRCGPMNDTHLVQTLSRGGAVRYEIYHNSNPAVLRVYNSMKNTIENNTTIHQTKNYKSLSGYYGAHGLYNTLTNKMYLVERYSGSYPWYKPYLAKQDLGPANTQSMLLNTNVDGTYVYSGFSRQATFAVDSTSIECITIPVSTGYTGNVRYICRDIYYFKKDNFIKQKQIYYGHWWEYAYDSRVFTGYPRFVNDNTVLIGDNLGNTQELLYTILQRAGGAYQALNHTKDKVSIKEFKRLYMHTHSNLKPYYRLDTTNAQGFGSYNAYVGDNQSSILVWYNIKPDTVSVYNNSFTTIEAVMHGGNRIQFDETTQYMTVNSTENDYMQKQYAYIKYTVNPVDGSMTQYISSYTTDNGKAAFADQQNRLIYFMRDCSGNYGAYVDTRTIFTINVDTNVKTNLTGTKYPRIGHLYNQTRDLETGYYYFLGTNKDNTTQIILIKCHYDSDYTVINEWVVENYPYYTSTTHNANFQIGETDSNMIKRDDVIIGIAGNGLRSFVIPMNPDSTTARCEYTWYLYVDDTVDREFRKPVGVGPYSVFWYKDRPVIDQQQGLFEVAGYDPFLRKVIHKKLFDCPYSLYVDSGDQVGYEDSTTQIYQRRYGYQFATEPKHYIMYPANKMWCFAKLDPTWYPYIPKMAHRYLMMQDQTVETNYDAYCNGWNIDSDIWFIARDSASSYSVGNTSVYYRYIEQRKFDTISGYEKIYRPQWKDMYSTGIYGTIPISWRNLDNSEQIDMASNGGCIYSWNSISNTIGKMNVWMGKSGSGMRTRHFGNPAKNYITVATQIQNTPSGSSTSNCMFVFNKKRNRWYQFPRYDQSKLNLSTSTWMYGIYVGGDHLLVPWSPTDFGRNYYYGGANCNAQNLMRFNTFFLPNCPDIYRTYWDDQSNMVWTPNMDYYIVPKPKFYNNIFSTDICPATFDEYCDSVHTIIDDRWQSLGQGMQQFRTPYDCIYMYKMHMNTSLPATDFTWVKNGKVNDEMSFNYRTLRYQRHNIAAIAYTWNNGNNQIIGSMAANLVTDFTAVDFTKVDSSTLFVGGLIKFDWTINAGWETIDLGRQYNDIKNTLTITRTDFQGSGFDDTMSSKCIWIPVTCECISTPFSQTVNFNDIVTKTVTEYNDFYITMNVTDSTNQTTTISVNNPQNTFVEFGNKKDQWIVRAAFFKEDSTYDGYTWISTFVVVPHIGRISQNRWDFSNAGITNNYLYENKYASRYTRFHTDTTANLWYAIPLLYGGKDNSIMWFADDVSNRLFCVQLGTGIVLSEYSDIKIRYKKPHGNTFSIWYDKIVGNDFLRYFGILGMDGTLVEIDKRDILTEHILNNKNYDVSDFTVTGVENVIQLIKGNDLTISGINIGNHCEFVKINWWFDTTDLMWVNVTIRNFNSHTNDEHILLINKTNQKWDIEGKRFTDLIQDNNKQISLPTVMKQLFNNSNGIISVKDSVNYPLFSKLIAYYDNDNKAIKYFDYKDGLIYKLEDTIVYDGAFFYRGLPISWSLSKKEFAIWDKMYPNMQYLDDLPDVYFYPHKIKLDETNSFGSPVDYIYDASNLYLLANLGSPVDQVEIQMDSIALINWSPQLAKWAIENASPEYVTQTLLDFTGYFPYGLVALERLNKWHELMSKNRYVKISMDMTFLDQSNLNPNSDYLLTDTVTDNTMLNPFTTTGFWTQKFSSVADMKSSSTMYSDFTNNASYITNRVFPLQDQRTGATGYYSYFRDDTGKFEIMLDPLGNNAVYCLYMTPLNLYYGHKMNADWNYPAQYKYYHSKVAVKVTITYNPDMYKLIDYGMNGKSVNIARDYTYAYTDMTLRAQDQKQIIQKNHTNRLYTQFNNMYDYSYTKRNYNQTQGVLFGGDLTNPPANIGGPSIVNYVGNVDQSAQSDGGVIIDSTNTPKQCQITFESDVTADRLYGLLTDMMGNSIQLDFTLILYNASNQVLTTSYYTGITPQNYCTYLLASQTFNETVFRKAEIIVTMSGGITSLKRGKVHGMFFKKGSLYTKQFLTAWAASSTYYGLIPSSPGEWPLFQNDSLTLLTGGWNDSVDKTLTIFGRSDMLGLGARDCTLFMTGYDGTYIEIDSGTNSYQTHDFTINPSCVGFKIKVKPETSKSVPIIEITSDSTNDDLSGCGANGQLKTGWIKGLK